MKKISLIVILTLIIAATVVWISTPKIAGHFISKALNDMGYSAVSTQGINIGPSGITIDSIEALGEGGKIKIENLNAIWHGMGPRPLQAVSIDKIILPYSVDTSDDQTSVMPSTLPKLPDINIDILKLRLKHNKIIHPIEFKDINLKNKNDQYTLSSSVSYNADGITYAGRLAADILDLNTYTATLNTDALTVESTAILPIAIKRTSGWANIKSTGYQIRPQLTAEMTFGVLSLAGVNLQSVTANITESNKDTYTLSAEGKGSSNAAALSLYAEAILSDAPTITGQFDLSSKDMSNLSKLFENITVPDISGGIALKSNFKIIPKDKESMLNIDQWSGGLGLTADLNKASYGDFKNMNTNLKASVDIDKKSYTLSTDAISSNVLDIKNLNAIGTYNPNGKITFTANSITIEDVFKTDITGSYNTKTKALSASYTALPLSKLNAKMLNELRAGLKLEKFTGDLSARGTFKKTENAPLKATHTILVRDANFKKDSLIVAGINGVLDVQSHPTLSASNQNLFIAGFDAAGLPLKNGDIKFDINNKGSNTVLRINDMNWILANGTLGVAQPFDVNMRTLETDMTLTAQRLNLETLFNLAPLDGLSATGHVSGDIPVKMTDGKLEIKNGILSALENGKIKYAPDKLPAFLQSDTPQMQYLREALKDYNYTELSMGVSGTSGINQAITLTAMGSNPDFYNGRAVKLNLTLEGELDDILKFNLGTYKLPDKIKEKMKTFEAKK